MIDLTAFDDAVLTQLRNIAGVSFVSIKTLESIDVLMDDATPSPSAHTLIGRIQLAPPTGNEKLQRGTIQVSVVVRARNVRGDGAVLKAPAGAYELIQSVFNALEGYVALACGPLYLVQITPIRVDRLVAVYELAFQADIEEDY